LSAPAVRAPAAPASHSARSAAAHRHHHDHFFRRRKAKDEKRIFIIAQWPSADWILRQQGLDTTTPAGKAMFQMMGVFAEFERAMIAERVRAGLARVRTNVAHTGMLPPRGLGLSQPRIPEDR
jgi:DNA invertase Pin-like site-specific DNA recombinase